MRRASAIRTASLCAALMFCGLKGCSSQASSPVPAEVSTVTLPEPLTHDPLQLQQVLDFKAQLKREQVIFALKKVLSQWNLNGTDKEEGFYILGKALQNSPKQADLESALAAFQIAKDLPSLKAVSLWHASEVAVSLGKEKVVRELLDQYMNMFSNGDQRSRAEYALAQSYLRANEPDRARAAFDAIQKNYSSANNAYSIGSNYYLGEIAWAKATTSKTSTATSMASSDASNQLNDAGSGTANGATGSPVPSLQVSNAAEFKTALAYFKTYLELSPNGHFTDIARARMLQAGDAKLIELSTEQLDAIANSYYVNGKFGEALAIWSKNPQPSRAIQIAACQARTKQFAAARASLLRAIQTPGNSDYVDAANIICLPMSKDDATKFWQEILQQSSAHKDTALWNVAIRLSPPASLQYFQRLIKECPDSPYAPEASWWVFWEAAQHKTGKDLLALIQQADKLAERYKGSKPAPRFLFWSGKIAEHAKNTKLATEEYKKLEQQYGADYYAFRAAERLAGLQKKPLPFGWQKKYSGSIPDSWRAPEPSKLNDKGLNQTAVELIKLKEFDESLQFLSTGDAETKSWVLAQLNRPVQSIVTAAKEVRGAPPPLGSPLWQYAYPLLYSAYIDENCRRFSNVDRLLMHSLVREESHYDANALSSSKAIGLTQVMPGTAYGVAKLLKISVRDQSEFFNPELNLKLGTEYFSYSLSKFQNNALFAVASYNGGAGAVRGWMSKEHARGNDDNDAFVENIPFRETRDYVRKVFGSYWNYMRIYGKAK